MAQQKEQAEMRGLPWDEIGKAVTWAIMLMGITVLAAALVEAIW